MNQSSEENFSKRPNKAVPILRAAVKRKLIYQGSDKHSRPWLNCGQKGSLCPGDVTGLMAQEMLLKSILIGKKRYAVDIYGQIYCAHAHETNKGLWHGFPTPWKKIPPQLVHQAMKDGLVDKKAVNKYWAVTRQ